MAKSVFASFLNTVLRKESFVFLICVIFLLQVRFYLIQRQKNDATTVWEEDQTVIYRDELGGDHKVSAEIYEKWTNPNYKLKVLFLMYKRDYDQHMDRWFQQTYEAAQRNSKLDVIGLWGEGFPGWRNDLPIWLNIQNKYGRVDVVHVHELHHAPDRGKVSDLNSGFFHEIQCVDGIGKCIEPPPFKYLDVVALSYANTGIYVTQYTGGKLYMHIPHGADKDLYYHPANSTDRNIDALLVGKVSGLYPLRSKLYEYIKTGQIPGTIREHPGYYMWEFPNDPKYHNNSQESQNTDYAKQLQRAKIVLLCSSFRKFALRKYVEAAIAGALIVGDVPAERQEEFREYMVEIDKDMSPAEIRAILEKWLADDEGRIARAAHGQRINLERYTYDKFIENLIKGWKAYLLQGMRGFHFPHPFVITKPWCIPTGNTPPHDCGI